MGSHNHVVSHSNFHATQSGLDLFLLLEKGRFIGIANVFVSCVVNLRRERLVSLAESNHFGVLFQLGLLLGRQLRRRIRIDRQTGKFGHLLNHLVGRSP